MKIADRRFFLETVKPQNYVDQRFCLFLSDVILLDVSIVHIVVYL